MSTRPSPTTASPPWEVLSLVAHRLDPKTLAVASCVCKTWSISMSSDQLWKPICTAHYPSLSNLPLTNQTVSYRRLYAMGFSATQRRLRPPSKPHISLDDLLFAIEVHTKTSHIITVESCEELWVDPNGVFRFDINVGYEHLSMAEVVEEVKITWDVVLKEWRGVFTMMDCKGKVSFVPGEEGWFSEELPSAGCCSSGGASGIVADLKLGLSGRRERGRKIKVEKVSVGILSIVNWRYVSVEDGLRYLQHFLCAF